MNRIRDDSDLQPTRIIRATSIRIEWRKKLAQFSRALKFLRMWRMRYDRQKELAICN